MKSTFKNREKPLADNEPLFVFYDEDNVEADVSSKPKTDDTDFCEVDKRTLRVPIAVLFLLLYLLIIIATQVIKYITFGGALPFKSYITPILCLAVYGVLAVFFLQKKYNKALLAVYTAYSVSAFFLSLLFETLSAWPFVYLGMRAVIIAFAVPFFIKSQPQLKKAATKLWFLPALTYGAASVLSSASYLTGVVRDTFDGSVDILSGVITAVGSLITYALLLLTLLSVMRWLINPKPNTVLKG